jgi:hypothetical protein
MRFPPRMQSSRTFFTFAVAWSILTGACAASTPDAEVVSSADCAAYTTAGRLPASPDEAAQQKRNGASYSNKEIRARYLCWVGQIGPMNEEWKAQGLPAEERAKRAYQARHDARLTARAMMANADEVKALQERDREKYGNPDGPTFEWLVEKARKKNLSGDAIYESIISSSQRTDTGTNKAMGL